MIIDTSNTIQKQGDFIARKLLLIEARIKECERLIRLYRCHCNDSITFADFVEEEAKAPDTLTFADFVEEEAKAPDTLTFADFVSKPDNPNKLTFSNFINHG